MLPDCNGRLYRPQKLAYISLNLFIVTVILLLYLITYINLLPIYDLYNLSSMFLVLFWYTSAMCISDGSLESDKSDISDSSNSINTSTRLYSLLLMFRLISLVSLEALTTQALLIYISWQCQIWIHLFKLTRWVSRPHPVITSALGHILTVFIVAMTLPNCASFSVKRFQSFLA